MRRAALAGIIALGLAACVGGPTARGAAVREIAAGFAAADRGVESAAPAPAPAAAPTPVPASARKPRIEYFQISEG